MAVLARTSIMVACAAALAGAPRDAAANPDAFTIGSKPVWFLLGGVTSGGTLGIDERGGFVGGELSLARLRDANVVGFYADAYYDWAIHGTYVTGGLEVGHKYFGLDAGVALRFADGQRDLGGTVRASIGLGVFSLFVRYAYMDAMSDAHVIQLGALLKLPWLTLGDGR